MLTLAIEATNPNVPSPGVLLARTGDDASPGKAVVLATRSLRQQGRHDDLLLPAIAELFEEVGAKPSELDEVLVSIGPGGFTATRLVCVAAAVLAEVSGASVLAVPTVNVAIETALQVRDIRGGVVVAMACKLDSAYVARFDTTRLEFSAPGRSIGPRDFDALLLPGDVLIHEGHVPEQMLEVASKRGAECFPMKLTAEGLLAYRSAAEAVPVEALRPIYPREPDAVTQWRRRYGKAPGDDS
ncbi:MAG: tRNA (adenosine(37)-N6)-threonylcarbamoyltransferase complex dimerization subunit type 1 TsaB [Phycisphaera sp.]|nr:MAG: tRNA (adenosine(37)-N6)-threonylcarbamoyltransferase complex dimerization subunit type 1 TsaB [Phycisphaera sp.]